MREQIAEYLAQGHRPVKVAEMLGCSEQYISELFHTDETFKELLRGKMQEYVKERLDNKYARLEENTLKELETGIANCDVDKLVRVLEGIARIKNANRAVASPAHYNNPTLGLTLVFPQQNIPTLVTDDHNRVIAIGDKTMLPMPAKAVRDIFRKQMEEEPISNQLTLDKLAHG